VAHKEQHLAELLKLPATERLEAGNALLDSLDDDDDPEWEAAWSRELTRRLAGLQDGSRKAIDAATVLAEARGDLEPPNQ
jgi:putative addiction module component (TIGR02574 family)